MLANRVRMAAGGKSEFVDKWTDIGSKALIGGSGDAGFFGEVDQDDFISFQDIETASGIVDIGVYISRTGRSSANKWLKFAYEDNIQFVPKRPLLFNISWKEIDDANCVRGDVKQVVIRGYTFKIRLFKGSGVEGDNTIYDYGSTTKGALCFNSEWNKLMLPIHAGAPSTWGDSGGNVISPTEDWGIDYTDADLVTNRNNGVGSYTWCQETAQYTSSRLRRGGFGVAVSTTNSYAHRHDNMGWRPVLELVR